ncbi:MAG: phosphomannomutase/phosphoglucomutase [Candidatus Aenigmatarchaeota archaeon]
MAINPNIFRAYDIRGIAGKDLTADVMQKIGFAFGKIINEDSVVIGSDARPSSPELKEAFIDGFLRSGKTAIDIGFIPIGAGAFFSTSNRLPYAYITASHLTCEWNGVKLFTADGSGLSENESQKMKSIVLSDRCDGLKSGLLKNKKSNEVLEKYARYLLSKLKAKRKLKIALDIGNGMAGLIAPKLFKKAGFNVVAINENIDCTFPNRNPEPAADPLKELKKAVENADMGIAYDGDGDRMVVVDEKGEMLSPEQISYILLTEIMKRHPGPIVANVECTRAIDEIVQRFGQKLYRIRVGHTWLVDGIKRYNAVFGVEVSGHYIVPWLLLFDDALAISLYFACIVSESKKPLSSIVDDVPVYPHRRINFECPDEIKFKVMQRLEEKLKKEFDINTLDGIRIELEKGWILIRPSNTSPLIRMTIEAEDERELKRIERRFVDIVKNEIDNKLP